MNKKLMTLFTTCVLGISLLAGGVTYAYFTSSAVNSGNTFTTGTVKISSLRDQGDTVPGPLFYTTALQGRTYDNKKDGIRPTGLWAPGDSVQRQLDVYNEGSLDVKFTKVMASLDPTSDIQSGDAAYTDFINKMNIKIQQSGSSEILYDGSLAGLLSGWVGATEIIDSASNPGGQSPCVHLTFTATLDTSAGESLQGKNPVFSFSVYAEQSANNS